MNIARLKNIKRKALKIQKEINDREGQVRTYLNLSGVYEALGKYVKSKSYCDDALAVSMNSGDKEGEANCYDTEGHFFTPLVIKRKLKPALIKLLRLQLKLVTDV